MFFCRKLNKIYSYRDFCKAIRERLDDYRSLILVIKWKDNNNNYPNCQDFSLKLIQWSHKSALKVGFWPRCHVGPSSSQQSAGGGVGGGITKPAVCVHSTICCLCSSQMLGEEDAVILCAAEVKSMSLKSVQEWDNSPRLLNHESETKKIKNSGMALLHTQTSYFKEAHLRND